MERELVSCLMLTGADPRRERFSQAAVRSFLHQTWKHKELVIINQSQGTDYEYRLNTECWAQVREIMVSPVFIQARAPTLGDLRNLSIAQARGDWLLPWDDDDWSHPERITWQMNQRAGDRAVLPTCYTAYSFPSDCAYVRSNPQCSGLILFPRGTRCYPSLPRNEDGEFAASFPDPVRWQNPPEMYLRFYHGSNTWDEKKIMRRLAGRRRTWELPAAVRKYLTTVLKQEYAWV